MSQELGGGMTHETPMYCLSAVVGGFVSTLPFNWSLLVGPAISVLGSAAVALFNYYLRKRQAESDVAYLLYKASREGIDSLKRTTD